MKEGLQTGGESTYGEGGVEKGEIENDTRKSGSGKERDLIPTSFPTSPKKKNYKDMELENGW